jgi:hypothetical protein
MKGYSKVRGAYKDTALVHVAHHLLIFLGPQSPFLNRTEALQKKYLQYSLSSKAAVGLFTCHTECGAKNSGRSIQPDKAFSADENRYPKLLVEVVAGEPGESCDIACSSVKRQCFEWGAIYAQMATHVLLHNSTVYRHRVFEPCTVKPAHGPMLAVARSDLPTMAMSNESIRLGSVRLFRCDVPTNLDSRRVCPCFNSTTAAIHGSVDLF